MAGVYSKVTTLGIVNANNGSIKYKNAKKLEEK